MVNHGKSIVKAGKNMKDGGLNQVHKSLSSMLLWLQTDCFPGPFAPLFLSHAHFILLNPLVGN